MYTDAAGCSFVTTRGMNRLVTVDGSDTKFYALQGVELVGSKTAVVPTVQGLQTTELFGEKDIVTVVKYYAMKGKPQALLTLDILLEVGVKVLIQNETGFNAAHESVQALFNQLRGYHRVCHAKWQAEAESRGLESVEIADLYVALFDGCAGAKGAHRMHKLMSLKRGTAAVDVVNNQLLDEIDTVLISYWKN